MSVAILRPLLADDLEMVRAWRNSSEVAQYMYNDELITETQQQAWFANVSEDPSKQYWIIMHQERPVGVANLYAISKTFNSCYWAFYLADQNTRGSGVGAKVEIAIIEHVFDTLKLNKLLCEVFVDNDKVITMHEKFGFRRESYFREHVRKNGTYKDVVGLALLKREWSQVRDNLRAKIYRS